MGQAGPALTMIRESNGEGTPRSEHTLNAEEYQFSKNFALGKYNSHTTLPTLSRYSSHCIIPNFYFGDTGESCGILEHKISTIPRLRTNPQVNFHSEVVGISERMWHIVLLVL
jgi:hypothetical protein